MKSIFKIQNIILVTVLLISSVSCKKDNDIVRVDYQIKGLQKKFDLAYMDENGKTINQKQISNSNWSHSFKAGKGTLLYLYCRYTEPVDMSTQFSFRILVDGKVYKEAFNYDMKVNDSTYQLIRYGSVPF